MKDEFADERLGDLPNAGYATQRERQLTDAVMMFIRGAERDRPWLLAMVCEGRDKFVAVFMKAHRAWRIDSELAESVYGYLVKLAGKNPHEQLEALHQMMLERKFGPRHLQRITARSESEVRDRIQQVMSASRR